MILVKRGRKRKIPSSSTTTTITTTTNTVSESPKVENTNEDDTEEKPATKKPRKPVPEGYNTGVYTELEEKNFIEGLELFGRDWTKVTENI
jgi:protein MYSM1